MSFEDFDQEIRDAAEKHHPAYHEEAWTRMEKMLNKHLPESGRRKRRALLLLPLLLMLAAGGYWLTNGNGSGKAVQTAENGKSAASANAPASANNSGSNNENNAPGTVTAGKKDNSPSSPGNTGSANNPAANSTISTGTPVPAITRQQPETENKIPPPNNPSQIRANTNGEERVYRRSNRSGSLGRNLLTPVYARNNGRTNKGRNRISGNPAGENDNNISAAAYDVNKIPPTNNTTSNTDEIQAAKAVQTPEPTPVTAEPKMDIPQAPNALIQPAKPVVKVKKPKNSFGNAFALTVSAGTDLAAVRFSESGTKRLVTGASLQYQVTPRITVRAGILQTHKDYAASPEDYKPGYLYTPAGLTLTAVDGDCRVLEFPVSVTYTLNPQGKFKTFAGAGVSGMAMQKEDYNFHYKSNYGQYRSYHYGISRQNEYLLASADLYAGVEKAVGKHLFFRAEPYLRLPVRGLGYGNIRFKSAGVIFTAGWKPFAKK